MAVVPKGHNGAMTPQWTPGSMQVGTRGTVELAVYGFLSVYKTSDPAGVTVKSWPISYTLKLIQ